MNTNQNVIKNTAKLLIVNHDNTLSSQLQKITGDTWNEIDYKSFEKGDVIQHKRTKRWFIVISRTKYEQLDRNAFLDLMSYYAKTYSFTLIANV